MSTDQHSSDNDDSDVPVEFFKELEMNQSKVLYSSFDNLPI